jgi:hypothetical protein
MKKKGVAGLAVGVIIACVIGLWPQSDEESARLLVGVWRATDPANTALRGRKEGVRWEIALFADDGSFLYEILPTQTPAATRPAEQINRLWAWKIQNGRLFFKDMGPNRTGECMQALKLSVSRKSLSLYRKGFPTKEFTRMN